MGLGRDGEGGQLNDGANLNPEEILQNTIENIVAHIRQDNPQAAINAIDGWDNDDVVELLVHMPPAQVRIFLGWMPRKQAGEVLLSMHPLNRSTITRSNNEELLSGMIGEGSSEETLGALGPAAQKYRASHAEGSPGTESGETVEVYEEGTAGWLMDRGLLAVTKYAKVQEVIDRIQAEFNKNHTVGTVFVVDPGFKPIGVFRPRELLKVSPDNPVSEIMAVDFPVIQGHESSEQAAQIVEGLGYMAVAVVNEEGRLIGQITPSLREQILAETRRTSMLKMSSVAADASSTDGIKKIIKSRLPWLLAGLIGATVAAIVIGSFEEQLEAAAILAAFIPVVMSMAGNSGLQASGVSVQALASGSVWPGDKMVYRLARECFGSLTNGAIAGSILAMLVLLGSLVFEIEDPLNLAMATSLSLMTVTTIAAIVGSSVPFALHRFGIDPATATGVFITTSNDVVGVLVYFMMADIFYF